MFNTWKKRFGDGVTYWFCVAFFCCCLFLFVFFLFTFNYNKFR